MTSSFDTTNYVTTDPAEGGIEVDVLRLDDIVDANRSIGLKIDVEGWEREVLAGATALLASPYLLFVIVEANGSGDRYGFTDDELLNSLATIGLTQVRYDPWNREIRPSVERPEGNALFVRLPDVAERVRCAESLRIGDEQRL
jgi:hypothetical protein